MDLIMESFLYSGEERPPEKLNIQIVIHLPSELS